MKIWFTLGLLICSGSCALANAPAMTPPASDVVKQAQNIVDAMKQHERGPYSSIRWFCNDGTSHPAKPYPCAERGGGRQHAEYSSDRQKLAQLGWHVGTVISALKWDELWLPHLRHKRLRELPLERYLETVDDGWILHKARHYRGRVQLEDEEKSGRELMLKLLGQPGFLVDNFLLVRELVRVIPHGTHGGDRTRTIRHLAQEVADNDTSFTQLRIEVHSRPSAGTSTRVRNWLSRQKNVQSTTRDKTLRLADGLDELYGLSGRKQRLQLAADALEKHSPVATRLIRESQVAESAVKIENLSQAIVQLRQDASEKEPGASLRRLGLLTDLEAEMRTLALERLEEKLSRYELLILARELLRASWGLGLLSHGESKALIEQIETILKSGTLVPSKYALLTRRLSLVAPWATQTVQYTFAEPLLYYTTLEPQAGRFIDDLLRDSVLLPLGELTHRLTLDGAQSAGIGHKVFGESLSGLLGVNPGIARGRLRILEPVEHAQGIQAAEDEIVVLTETLTELPPVAGILTLGEGNPLSHVQMLARNLGIPNTTVPPDLLSKLRKHAGQQVLLAVATDGRVLLEQQLESSKEPPRRESANVVERLMQRLRHKVDPGDTKPVESTIVHKVKAPQPDLSRNEPLPLSELHSGLSGKIVGPKAANIGQLNRLFPDRIAPAIALPFGVFAQHTVSARQRLVDAYRKYRSGELNQEKLDSELDTVREQVAALVLQPELVKKLGEMMQREFVASEPYGLFVRSDTNAEDLPEFTGAGLNKTVPNVIGLDKQLEAVVQVWSSVYTRRAMAWRARILENPEAVYASVLLMKSVPSVKSGVLVTTDLSTGSSGLTVSVAWGVGGAVDNESAASRILRPDGSSLLLAEAKAPYQRVLSPEGGIAWQPATSGSVLLENEMDDLRKLADEVHKRYPPVIDDKGNALPWDIEFAFAKDKLWLLQIRPLIQRGRGEAEALLNQKLPMAVTSDMVPLDKVPVSAIGPGA